MPPRHQAILEVGVLAQRRDEKVRGDDQHEDNDKPDQSRPAVVRLAIMIVSVAHGETLPVMLHAGKRFRRRSRRARLPAEALLLRRP